jgi:hypothetical protein
MEVKTSDLPSSPLNNVSSPSQSATTATTSASTNTSRDSTNTLASHLNSNSSASVWETLLQRAAGKKNLLPNTTLVILGSKGSGKSGLLSKFSDRVSSDSSKEYVLDYSYINVKNKFNADKDEILSQMNCWQLDDPKHAELINTFIKSNPHAKSTSSTAAQNASSPPSATSPNHASSLISPTAAANSPSNATASSHSDYLALDTTLFLITVNLSEPWAAVNTVKSWLQVLQKFRDSIFPRLSSQEQRKLTEKISRAVQSYNNPDLLTNSASNSEENQLNPDLPAINLGFPVLIIGTHADNFSRSVSSKSNIDEKFEFLTNKLRFLALQYGAALFYTSSAGRGAGVNIELLQQYILHRLYSFALSNEAPIQPKLICTEEDFSVYIPAGFDSENLINSLQSKHYNTESNEEEVFKAPTGSKSTHSNSNSTAKDSIKAQENVLFYKSLKFALEQGGGLAALGLVNSQANSAGNQRGSTMGDNLLNKPANINNPIAPPSANKTENINGSNAVGSAAGNNTASNSSGAAAAAAAAAANKAKFNPKGQIAVKQFFRSLLNNNPGSAAPAAATGVKAGTDKSTVRAQAEKELRKMTDNQDQPPQ